MIGSIESNVTRAIFLKYLLKDISSFFVVNFILCEPSVNIAIEKGI